MINIQTYKNGSKSTLMSNIGKDNSLLIIGRGGNENKLNDIFQPTSQWEVEDIFGSSELTDAYIIAKRAGAENIFLINCYKTSDFIAVVENIRQYNFAYIAPIGIKLSDMFYDANSDKDIYFAEHYLSEFSKFTNSLIIFTDEHASLYEDIDSFIYEMKNKAERFKESVNYILTSHGRNFAFCMNVLEGIPYSNVLLTAILSKTDPGKHPDTFNYKAVYDLDSGDPIPKDTIYFKNNIHTGTSIENLNNFRIFLDASKIVPIDKVIRYIERNIDTSFILGKLYSKYTEMLLHDYIDNFLRGLLEKSIRNYYIRNISFVKTDSMTGFMKVEIDIYPINSLEVINVSMEVK